MSNRSDVFLDRSASLTGFGRVELRGTGMTDLYLLTLEAVLPADVLDELLAPQADPAEILADPKLGPPARNVILLWYCGTWTALPDDWRARYGSSPLDTSRVVSAEAYQQGLQWVVAGAHPMGARQQGYGAWSAAPESVSR